MTTKIIFGQCVDTPCNDHTTTTATLQHSVMKKVDQSVMIAAWLIIVLHYVFNGDIHSRLTINISGNTNILSALKFTTNTATMVGNRGSTK